MSLRITWFLRFGFFPIINNSEKYFANPVLRLIFFFFDGIYCNMHAINRAKLVWHHISELARDSRFDLTSVICVVFY